MELMNASQQRGGTTFAFRNEVGRIQRALESAKKDNDFIYHDKIPDLKNLPAIGKAAVAKPTPFSPPLSSKFTGNAAIIQGCLVSAKFTHEGSPLAVPCPQNSQMPTHGCPFLNPQMKACQWLSCVY